MVLNGSQWLTCHDHQWLPVVLNGCLCFSVVTSVSQWLPVVLNGYHAVVLNGYNTVVLNISKWFPMLRNSSERFSIVLSGFPSFSITASISRLLPVLLNGY